MLDIRLPLARFITNSDLFAEKGSLSVIRAFGATRMAILVSQSIWKNAETRQMIEKASQGVFCRVIEMPSGEPHLSDLMLVAKDVSQFRPDWIVSIGGGSVIDGAKIIWAVYENPYLNLERATRPGGLPKLRGLAKFAAIPTTSGTGSEVSSAAVFGVEDRHIKKFMVSNELIPDVAILDPRLLVSCPPQITAFSGFDVLAHCIEGYVSRQKNPLANIFAEKGVQLVLENLERSIERPEDLDTRLQMQIAATFGGWVQNLKVPGLGHAVAHQFSSFGMPHGLACSWALVPSIEFNSQSDEIAQKYRTLFKACGFDTIDEFLNHLSQLQKKLGLLEMRKKFINPKQLESSKMKDLVEGAMRDPCARFNPIGLTNESVLTFILNLFEVGTK